VGLAGLTAAPAAAAASPFTVNVTPSANPVASGSSLTWTINVVNTGGDEVDGVTLLDQVPGMTGLTLSSTVGTCTQSANQVDCNADSLPGGASWTVTIRGTVTAANGTTLNNTADVSGNQAVQSYETQGTGTTLVSAAPSSSLADLTVSIAAPSTAAVSSPVTYQLTVNNTGGANAQGITVQDTLPAGFAYSSASGSSLFTCSAAGGIVTCTGGQISAGSNASITIAATAAAGSGSFTDTAVVNPTRSVVGVVGLDDEAPRRPRP